MQLTSSEQLQPNTSHRNTFTYFFLISCRKPRSQVLPGEPGNEVSYRHTTLDTYTVNTEYIIT